MGTFVCTTAFLLLIGLKGSFSYYLDPRVNRKVAQRISFRDCSVGEFERRECGFFGMTFEQCRARDCCWKRSNLPGVPWCFHTISNSQPQCIVPAADRVDCGFVGMTSEQCRDAGCCWMPIGGPTLDNAPWCFEGKGGAGGVECGVPAITPNVQQRIVGGVPAVAGSWPWQVSLQTRGNHFCAGTIISPEWVVSAAHCRRGFSSQTRRVVVGMHKKSEKMSDMEIEVEEVIAHENYGQGHSKNHDIMLIKLATPLQFNDTVSPACLPKMGEDVKDGAECYTTGWGATRRGGSSPDELHQVMVPCIRLSICNQPDWYGGRVTEFMICAGYERGGKDSCQGDSGGPYVCRKEGRWVLEGVVSWGQGCASPRKPGLYSRVTKYIEWIHNNTGIHL